MRILVTGGAGFIGTHLVEKLKKDQHEVMVVDRKLGQDITDLKSLRLIFKTNRFNSVVHLAAETGVRQSWQDADKYIKTNIVGTHNLWRLMGEFGVRQIIFASSSSIYGKRGGRRGFLETDLPAPVSPYAATKVAGEALCQVYAKETGIKTTVLRFFTVYGPGNRQDMAAFNFTRDILAQKPINLFGYNTKRDFTFVDDIIDGILGAIVRPFDYEVINLGSSRPVKVIELIREIEKTAGKKAKINRGGLPAGDVPVTFANIDKAKKLLGWQPHTSLKAGVEKLVEWYKLR